MGRQAFAEMGLQAATTPDAVHEDGLENNGSGKEHGRNHSSITGEGQRKMLGNPMEKGSYPQINADFGRRRDWEF
jgi:hypothetical protein